MDTNKIKLEELEKEVEKIKARNRRVELDKTWELSNFRRFLIFAFTYLANALYMNAINIKDAWLNAVIPSIGFLLSTLTLPFFKSIWQKYIKR